MYETNLGNFGTPKDLMRYMMEEGIDNVHITAKFCDDPVGIKGFEMSIEEAKKWMEGKL